MWPLLREYESGVAIPLENTDSHVIPMPMYFQGEVRAIEPQASQDNIIEKIRQDRIVKADLISFAV